MQFRVLGALEVASDGAAIDLGPPKQRALLAILLMHAGQIVPSERLIELLWGDSAPRTASHSIQIYVSELRKMLEPLARQPLILTRQPGYQLDVPAEAIDAWQFEQFVEVGVRQLDSDDLVAGATSLRQALQLWRGPALSDFTYEEFAQPYIRRLHDVHLDAVEALAGAELKANRPAEALALAEGAIREDPLRERAYELLMLGLYRTGRHAEALRSFDRLRLLLSEELGLDPSPALRRLRDRVLLHDPSLVPSDEPHAAPLAVRNPYKGLRSFQEADSEDFFGRDSLIAQVLEALAQDKRVVALIGPSGSGKSSVIAAGLIPRLRGAAVAGSDSWTIVRLTPSGDPVREVKAVLGEQARSDVEARAGPRRTLLVIDQFEQLFTLGDEQARRALLLELTASLSGPSSHLRLVLALRADYYDRPLQHPEFAELFVPNVVNVLPMTAAELKAAIVEPAENAGVHIEQALLAELVAETAERPGSLPLLQYTLTELFEQRTTETLTVPAYRALGGLRGVLTRRAEELYTSLTADEQLVATQAFLRMTRPGRGAADSRRRVALSELTDLGVDTVALSEVLTAFGRHRLVTFDRDPLNGEATVEIAHEALLSTWERLASWIDRHRSALRRREALVAAVDEWDAAGRHPDYLPSGSRLDEFSALNQAGALTLTAREEEYLAAAQSHQLEQVAREAERAATQRKLERSARLRLVALGLALLLLGGATVYGLIAAGATRPKVALGWISDWGLVDRQLAAGFDRAVSEFGLPAARLPYDDLLALVEQDLGRPLSEADMGNPLAWAAFDRAMEAELRRLSGDDYQLVIVMGVPVEPLLPVANENRNTRYVFVEPIGEGPNIAHLTFADEEGAFLAGAAAGLTSESGVIGFVGGVENLTLWRFEAGFEAGARAVRPDVHLIVDYTGDWMIEEWAEEAARAMYVDGADVVMHAAGNGGLGVFQAALMESREQGRHLWAIGVDTDQHETVLAMPGAINARAWQTHILTSAIKRFDLAVYTIVAELARGNFRAGAWNWGLAEGGLDLSYSGGHIDGIRPVLENLKTRIIAGDIDVPCLPERVRDEAAAQGIDPLTCSPGEIEAP